MTSPLLSRRNILLGGLGLASTATLAACTSSSSGTGVMPSRTIGPPTPVSPSPGQKVLEKTLTARPVSLDLGGRTVATWAYDGALPGPLVRATAGDFLRLTLDNQLPADTTIHWHGIRLPNAADGVPGLTQDPVKTGGKFVYEFTAPDPGTYFFHPHVGVQLDRGLYAPMIIDDPGDPGGYDAEWILVLDDWIDGTGTTPDEVFKKLIADGGPANGGGMGGMDHGSMGGMSMGTGPWGDAGDITYPLFLINGKPPTDPDVLAAKPGQKVRLRVINAASDTIFAVALGGTGSPSPTVTGTRSSPPRLAPSTSGWASGTTPSSPSLTAPSPLWPDRSARPAAARPWPWSVPAPALLLRLPLTRASWLVRSSSAHSCARPKPPSCRARSRTPPSTWPCKAR